MYQCGGPAATCYVWFNSWIWSQEGFQQTQQHSISTAKISLLSWGKDATPTDLQKKEPYTGG